MSIKLTWKNPNQVPVTQTLYRSTTQMVVSALPAPLASFTEGETSYVDTTAVDKQTYYYMMAVTDGTNTLYSIQTQITAEDRRGVGPNTITVGTEDLGYYGKIDAGKFISSSHVMSAAKTQAGITNNGVIPAWFKFSRHGKIIYVPDRAFGFASWLALYNAGLVYGRDDAGPAAMIGGLTPVNQDVYVEFAGDKYRVRLMRGFYDKATDLNAAVTATDFAGIPAGPVTSAYASAPVLFNMDTIEATTPENEYNDMLMSVVYGCPLKKRFPTVNNGANSAYMGLVVSDGYTSNPSLPALLEAANKGRMLCQERVAGASAVNANVLDRGVMKVAYNANSDYGNYDPVTSYLNNVALDAGNSTYIKLWVPVLELIETPLVLSF